MVAWLSVLCMSVTRAL